MATDMRLRLLAREVEMKAYFGEMIAADLEEARRDPERMDEQIALLGALVSTASKTSRLLWRYGKRTTDTTDRAEAEVLRDRLGLAEDSPLSPERVAPVVPAVSLSPLDLADAWDPDEATLTLAGITHPLSPIVDALHTIRRNLADAGVSGDTLHR